MTEWNTRPTTTLVDGDILNFPGGYQYAYRVYQIGRRCFAAIRKKPGGPDKGLNDNEHVLRQAFGLDYEKKVNAIYGYAHIGGAWPEAVDAEALTRLVLAVWDELDPPALKSRADLEALYG